MANGVATNLDPAGVALFGVEHLAGTFAFAGADDLAAGTILSVDTSAGSASKPAYILYNPAGAGDELVPSAVLEDAVSVTGATTVAIRPIVSGTVRFEALSIDAGTALTATHMLALRDKGIIAQPVNDLAEYDNALS